MEFFILVLLICLFVFLYCVYLLANDDFIFLRKDISMERLFNITFLGGIFSLFFGRLFYALSQDTEIFSSIIVFLLFPYFPGLSLLGGVVGAGIGLIILTNSKKDPLPLGRLADFFSIAFLVTLSIGFLGYYMFSQDGFPTIKAGSIITAYLFLAILFLKFLLPLLLSGKLKEGTIGLLFLVCFSVVSLISNSFPFVSFLEYFKDLENILLVALLISSTGFLAWHQGPDLKFKRFKS